MPRFWECPRCRWKEPYGPESRCRGCGLSINGMDMQVSPRAIEELRYEIRDIRNHLTSNKTKDMSTVGSMMKRLLDKDTQALVKAGYINGDLELTDKGKSALWAILFSANKDALVAEAKEVLEAEKAR